MSKDSIATALFDIGAIKFGSFKLKSGITSPLYIDLRLIVSYPELLRRIAEEMWNTTSDLEKDCICGVPYTALPIATAISLFHNIPMIMRRKEVKEYGTKRAIEGSFKKGDRCIVIEDLVTSGSSVFETVAPLEHEGLMVKDVVVLIDREQGGKQNLHNKGYSLHAVYKLTEVINALESKKKITSLTKSQVFEFLEANQVLTLG
jgi:uridine monophosphate synthetase